MKKNPLRPIFWASFFTFLVLLIIYIVIKYNITYDQDPNRTSQLKDMLTRIEMLSQTAWDFIKPFLQLILILLITDWVLTKLGISFTATGGRFDWNIQTVIAVIIVGSFALAALSGIAAVSALRDIVLVVIGFYFGTQKKTILFKNDKGELQSVEEHTNEVK